LVSKDLVVDDDESGFDEPDEPAVVEAFNTFVVTVVRVTTVALVVCAANEVVLAIAVGVRSCELVFL
jgi:hypothetical protein